VGELQYVCLMPHPPIIIPEVGGEESEVCRATIDAMEEAANKIVDSSAETVVVITAHGNVFQDAVSIIAADTVKGDMGQFNASEVKFDYPYNLKLAEALQQQCRKRGINVAFIDKLLAKDYGLKLTLDHGVMVPLYYLQKAGFQGSLVVVAMGLLPFLELYSFGVALQEAVVQHQGKAALLASGDMSHRLTQDAPAGFNPRGQEFDDKLQQYLVEGAVEDIVHIPEALVEEAGECGLRPIVMALGALDGYQISPRILSYQGPFGVGYLVAELFAGGEKGDSIYPHLEEIKKQNVTQSRAKEHQLVRLARETLEAAVHHGQFTEPDHELPEDLPQQAGVFVSLKKGGQLRGCIGTIEPTQDNLVQEVMRNALSAGLSDPRFDPVEERELKDITYSVDVLHPAEDIDSAEQLDPQKYGVIVRSGARSGLLLPNLEGINTVAEQVNIALGKGGINPRDDYSLQRFKVDRYY